MMTLDLKSGQITGLCTSERAELGRCEEVIGRGLVSFLDVARALMTIRDQNLYRETYGTFEDYCRRRWDIGSSRARQLIAATEVVGNLESVTSGNTFTERQIRPLVRLEPDQQREAYLSAAANASDGKPTSAQVKQAAHQVKPRSEVKAIRGTGIRPAVAPAPATVRYSTLPPSISAEPKPEPTADPVVIALCHVAEENLDDFVKRATLAQLEAALHTIPTTDKWRWLKIGNRRELLITARNLGVIDAPELVVEHPKGILTREWVIHVLSRYDPANADFATALKAATLDDLRNVLASLSTKEKHHGARLCAITTRLDELETPDLRLAQAIALRDGLQFVRDLARADYHALTGMDTDLLEFERGIAKMLPRLTSLIGTLESQRSGVAG